LFVYSSKNEQCSLLGKLVVQIKKLDIQVRILKEARREFLSEGFHKANMRKIAISSEVSLANLYSYHANKDALFCAVVNNVKIELEKLENFFKSYRPKSLTFDSLEIEIERANSAAQYIHKNRIEIHLLFNKSNGTSLENFTERLVSGYVINCKNLISFLLRSGVEISFVPTDFFFSNVARLFIEAIKEAVRAKLSLKLIEKHAEELTKFNYFGFQGVSNYNNKDK
jgi:AcrR family transcriptional regulator